MIGLRHHDPRAIAALKASGPVGRRLRIVDERTAYMPLEKAVFDDPSRLLKGLRTLLRPSGERAYSPRPSKVAAHDKAGLPPS